MELLAVGMLFGLLGLLTFSAGLQTTKPLATIDDCKDRFFVLDLLEVGFLMAPKIAFRMSGPTYSWHFTVEQLFIAAQVKLLDRSASRKRWLEPLGSL